MGKVSKALNKKGLTKLLLEIEVMLENYNIELLDVSLKESLPYISFSRMKLYNLCPRAFQQKYKEERKANPTPDIIFGKCLHSALEFYNKSLIDNNAVSFTEVVDNFELHLKEYDERLYPREKIQFPQEAQSVLCAYFKWLKDKKIKPIETEYEFLLRIQSLKDLNEDLIINGCIDLIDERGLFDYKSNFIPPKGYEGDISLQLSLYSLVFYIKYKRWPEYSQNIHLVRKNNTVELTPKTKNARRTLGQVEVMIENLKDFAELSKKRFLPTPNFSCTSCSYKEDCPASPLHKD